MRRGKRWWWIGAAVLVVALALLLWGMRSDPAEYHLRKFRRVSANMNDYHPSVFDLLSGIRSNVDKWDFHLQKLEELGAVEHRVLVFTEVPFTKQANRRIWKVAESDFSDAVMFTANWYGTNDSAYGVVPFTMEVWDAPERMDRWEAFLEQHNHPDPE